MGSVVIKSITTTILLLLNEEPNGTSFLLLNEEPNGTSIVIRRKAAQRIIQAYFSKQQWRVTFSYHKYVAWRFQDRQVIQYNYFFPFFIFHFFPSNSFYNHLQIPNSSHTFFLTNKYLSFNFLSNGNSQVRSQGHKCLP